jgi:hypothetical protein
MVCGNANNMAQGTTRARKTFWNGLYCQKKNNLNALRIWRHQPQCSAHKEARSLRAIDSALGEEAWYAMIHAVLAIGVQTNPTRMRTLIRFAQEASG